MMVENRYIKEMRQRLGLEEYDTSRDDEIEKMPPMARVRLITGWYQGDSGWADTFKRVFESQGLYLTTNPKADGVVSEEE